MLTGVIIGLVTGVLSGLLGIGGGGVLVALSVTFLALTQHAAQAAAIVATIPTALVGVINLHRKRLVNYQVAGYLAIGVAAGGMVGAYLANIIPEAALRKVFSVFFAITSIQLFWSSRGNKNRQKTNKSNN
ncbi:hypothetical protein SCACP_15050 [Sporomusa carbonis]|uniref:TSUP family transporter n=1 Tax=Sporomusa carbonis TaxID=3076075 RepID=UPI003A71ED06